MPKGALRSHLRNRIAMWREFRGLTQRELARLIGVSESALAKWEVDRPIAPPAAVGRLARVLRCMPRDLFPKDFV